MSGDKPQEDAQQRRHENEDDSSLLCTSVLEGNLHAVQMAFLRLVSSNSTSSFTNMVDATKYGRWGRTPLLLACYKDGTDTTLEMVRALLDAGADPNITDSRGKTPLHGACWYGRVQIVKALLDSNANVNAKSNSKNSNNTPIHVASTRGHSKIMRMLLEKGADPTGKNLMGEGPLHCACWNGHIAAVRTLLDHDADLWQGTDNCGETPLHFASWQGHLQIVRELIEQYGANMFAKNRCSSTPMDLAFAFNHSEVAEYLLGSYRDNTLKRHGQLSLHAILQEATYSDHFMFLSIGRFGMDQTLAFLGELLAQVVDPMVVVRNDFGEVPLHIACSTGAPEHVVEFLLEEDATALNKQDQSGGLPVHSACRSDNPIHALRLLVDQDAAMLHKTDRSGALPIHVACRSGAPKRTIQYLVDQGGDGTLRVRDCNLALPLHLACAPPRVSLRAVKYLLKAYPKAVLETTSQHSFPFMLACESSAPESVIFAWLQAYPDIVASKESTDS